MEYVPVVTKLGPSIPMPPVVVMLELNEVGPVTIKSKVSSPKEASFVILSVPWGIGGPPASLEGMDAIDVNKKTAIPATIISK